ncbi:hypothetical protein [Yoonia sp.]|uniref:hypothetical protein n=1 Tax=Yoonia sp. TaxID=2212373 RepID=UPI00358F51FA
MTRLAWFGVVLTVTYLLTIGLLISQNWEAFASLEPNAWGDFLAGSLGPLGIFWLVLGYFQQGRELQNSVDALNLQAKELRNSVKQQQAMVRITEQQLNLDIQLHDKETLLATTRELPFFQLTEITEQGLPTLGNMTTQKYKLANHGAHANRVYISTGSGNGSVNPSSFGSFPHNESREIQISTGNGMLSSTRLIVESTSLKNQQRRQEFSIHLSGVEMTVCFPEQ